MNAAMKDSIQTSISRTAGAAHAISSKSRSSCSSGTARSIAIRSIKYLPADPADENDISTHDIHLPKCNLLMCMVARATVRGHKTLKENPQ